MYMHLNAQFELCGTWPIFFHLDGSTYIEAFFIAYLIRGVISCSEHGPLCHLFELILVTRANTILSIISM
jgi:hypothetical protein